MTCDEEYKIHVYENENVPSVRISTRCTVHGWALFFDEKKLGLDYRCNNKPLSMIFVGSLFRWVDFCCWGTTYKKSTQHHKYQTQKGCIVKSEPTKIGHNLSK